MPLRQLAVRDCRCNPTRGDERHHAVGIWSLNDRDGYRVISYDQEAPHGIQTTRR